MFSSVVLTLNTSPSLPVPSELVVFFPCGCVVCRLPDFFFFFFVSVPAFPHIFLISSLFLIFPFCYPFFLLMELAWQHRVCTAMLGLQLLVTAVVHHLEGAGGRLPAEKWRAKPRMCIWFATQEHFAANSAQHLCMEILPCRGAERSLPFPAYSFTRVFSHVSVCVMKMSFSWSVEFGLEFLDWANLKLQRNFRSWSLRKP